MTEFIPPVDDLLVSEEQNSNLTYFAFAKPHEAVAALAPTKASIGALPELLAGRYRIECLLGAGGMGAVYRARDLLGEQFGDPDRYIALKILSEEFSETPDASALLYIEFALTRCLRYDSILRLHSFEVDTDCQRAFITRARGKFLSQRAVERHRAGYQQAQGWADQTRLTSGHFLALSEHPRKEWHDLWRLTQLSHEGKQP